jgi:VanZ family protein
MALIFYLSSQSKLPDFDEFDFGVKKLAHFTVYALLYLFLFRAFHLSRQKEKMSIPALLIPAAIAVLYAISDEIHQSFVPLRTATARDVIIDSVGILTMAAIIRKWWSFLRPAIEKTAWRWKSN